MTKPEFLSAIAKKAGHTPKDVKIILKSFQEVLLEELQREGKVNILDLGQFKVSVRSARTGVNPQTKKPLNIPEKKVPKLAPSRRFKDFIEGKEKIDSFDY